MQFLVYATDPSPEASPPPTEALMAAVGSFIQEATQAGALVTTGSVNPKGTRVRLSGGKFSVTDGPFVEAKELMGGFAVIRAKSLEEAIEWAKRFRQIIGDGESEIVQILGPD